MNKGNKYELYTKIKFIHKPLIVILCTITGLICVTVTALLWYPPLHQSDYPQAVNQHPYINSSTEDKVNINTAPIEELTVLPGIGDTKAAAIVEYRKVNGAFLATDDLLNVHGIGVKTIDAIKNLICFN